MKIDIYPHIMPEKYRAALYRKAGGNYFQAVTDGTPTLWDLETRFRIMDRYEGMTQVLTLASPSIESVFAPKEAAELTRMANDEMAELVRTYPDRFVAAAASLPMNDLDASLEELDRAVRQLGMKGVQFHSPVGDKPLDSPDFLALYARIEEYGIPIWIHPKRSIDFADYKSENHSKYWIFSMFGWPYETTAAMTRLVFSGILEKFPGLKIITHHCGGMVPYFVERIIGGQDYAEVCCNAKFKRGLSKPPIDYYRTFYADTALYGASASLMCGYDFFGPDRIVFGSDMPYDSEGGDRYVRQTIEAIERMDISDADKQKIYEGNARKLLKI